MLRIGVLPYLALGVLFQFVVYGDASFARVSTWVHIVFWVWFLLGIFIVWFGSILFYCLGFVLALYLVVRLIAGGDILGKCWNRVVDRINRKLR